MNKIYKVTWTDASGIREDGREWYSVDDAEEIARKMYESKNVNFGHIIARNKQYLIIAGGTALDSYSDLTMIPIKMVNKIKELK